MPTIDSALRLVLPLRADAEGKPTAWAYHTPIGMETFDANYRVLAATKAKLFEQGGRYAFEAGALVAALHLRDEGKKDAAREGDLDDDGKPRDGGVSALLADFRRLTMVVVPGPGGWDQVPVEVALQRGSLDTETWREAESTIVFFTCIYWLTPKAKRRAMADSTASVCGGSTTSSSLTDWIASLTVSTSAANTAKAA